MSTVQPDHYAPPPGSPPPSEAQTLPPQPRVDDLLAQDNPPPYAATVLDPVPEWSAPALRFDDLTDTENPSELARLPLDPPPSCFSSPTPLRIRSRSFEPFRIPSRGPNLQGGFRLVYAPDLLTPHGISVADWTRFLQDLGIAARLSAQGFNVRGSSAASASPKLGFFRGNSGSAYEAAFAKTPAEEVQGLITVWNQSALERRKVRVSLQPRIDASGRQRDGWDLLVEAM